MQGGESQNEVAQRVVTRIEQIASQHPGKTPHMFYKQSWANTTMSRSAWSMIAIDAVAVWCTGQTILLILHGGVLHACYRHATGHIFHGRNVNCAINAVKVEGKKWSLVTWNDADHLHNTGFMASAFGGGGAGGWLASTSLFAICAQLFVYCVQWPKWTSIILTVRLLFHVIQWQVYEAVLTV